MKKKWIIVVAAIGTCLVGLMACTGKVQELASSGTDQTASDIIEIENSEEVSSKEAGNEQVTEREHWIRLMGSYYKRINLEARTDFIGGFMIDGNSIFKAASYNGSAGSSEGLYCYFFEFFFDKTSLISQDLLYPEELSEVANDIRENNFDIWETYLRQPNASFLARENLSLRVDEKDIVVFNGKEFLREEIFARSERMSGRETTTRFVAYYYQAENGEGFCVFGDCSENQDQFENVKIVADAIMATYRESDE